MNEIKVKKVNQTLVRKLNQTTQERSAQSTRRREDYQYTSRPLISSSSAKLDIHNLKIKEKNKQKGQNFFFFFALIVKPNSSVAKKKLMHAVQAFQEKKKNTHTYFKSVSSPREKKQSQSPKSHPKSK